MDQLRNMLVAACRKEHESLRQLAVLACAAALPPGVPSPEVRYLAEYLQIYKPAVTRAIDTLVEQGLARRQRVENDHRLVLVVPTASGLAHLRAIAEPDLSVKKKKAA